MHELNEHVLSQLKEQDPTFPDIKKGILVPQVCNYFHLSIHKLLSYSLFFVKEIEVLRLTSFFRSYLDLRQNVQEYVQVM